MKFAFKKMTLSADSFYDLINTWAEMQLVITEGDARIVGYGYTRDIAGAFSTLVLDWEAHIPLPASELDMPGGSYDLILEDGVVLACRDQRVFPLGDRPVRVEVVSVPED